MLHRLLKPKYLHLLTKKNEKRIKKLDSREPKPSSKCWTK